MTTPLKAKVPHQANVETLGPPALIKRLLELRAAPEYVSGFLLSEPLNRCLPRGDGHPVVVVPAFMGNAFSTRRLRLFLMALGYETFDWKLGRNIGPVGPTEQALLARVQMIHERLGRKPSLVGWSLGGVYARILAHSHPQHLRSVITLGSPLRHPHQSSADSLYQHFSGQMEHPGHLAGLERPPPIPATSVYSRLDGIVNWRSCLSEESPMTENIGVYGSHCGLGFNPLVHWIVADRLGQDEQDWQPFTWRNLPGF